MRKIPFKGTVRKFGNSHGVIIPAAYIGKEIKEGDDYWITIDTKKGENNEQGNKTGKTE